MHFDSIYIYFLTSDDLDILYNTTNTKYFQRLIIIYTQVMQTNVNVYFLNYDIEISFSLVYKNFNCIDYVNFPL